MIRRLFVGLGVAATALVLPGVTPTRASEPASCAPPGGIALPVGVHNCAGVHPGGKVSSSQGTCTLNFLFTGSDGKRYIGTAGHCILPDYVSDQVFASPGPVAKVDGQTVGEFAYATLGGGRDFALIRLRDDVVAWPNLTYFGGPTGVYTDHSLTPVVLHHYGSVSLTAQPARARSMVAPNTFNPQQVAAVGTGTWGDSGSAVIDSDGRAVGVLVTLGGFAFPSAGTNGISRLDYQLPFAQNALGVTLTLQTAPLRTPLA